MRNVDKCDGAEKGLTKGKGRRKGEIEVGKQKMWNVGNCDVVKLRKGLRWC